MCIFVAVRRARSRADHPQGPEASHLNRFTLPDERLPSLLPRRLARQALSSPGGALPLPLLQRATPDGLTFALTRRSAAPAAPREREDEPPSARHGFSEAKRGSIPLRTPDPGEQYRFHFDMKKCIGCKCCVVACNEQNGNPAAINWRRVGEIEGGWFPDTTRSYLSMGCNHCL